VIVEGGGVTVFDGEDENAGKGDARDCHGFESHVDSKDEYASDAELI